MFAMQPRVVTTVVSRDHQSLAVVTSGSGGKWVVIGIHLRLFAFMTAEREGGNDMRTALGSFLAGALGVETSRLSRHRRR